jgi:hypothetical protein
LRSDLIALFRSADALLHEPLSARVTAAFIDVAERDPSLQRA